MTIKINDSVGFTEEEVLQLAQSLLHNRRPKEGFDYGLESHGAIFDPFMFKLPYPIVVCQSNKRKSNKSPIVIHIKKHSL